MKYVKKASDFARSHKKKLTAAAALGALGAGYGLDKYYKLGGADRLSKIFSKNQKEVESTVPVSTVQKKPGMFTRFRGKVSSVFGNKGFGARRRGSRRRSHSRRRVGRPRGSRRSRRGSRRSRRGSRRSRRGSRRRSHSRRRVGRPRGSRNRRRGYRRSRRGSRRSRRGSRK